MIDNMDNNSKINKPYLKGVSPVINVKQGETYDVSYMFRAIYESQEEKSGYHNE